MSNHTAVNQIVDRFRGFLPVVIDVETGGFNAQTDALLEIAAIVIEMDDQGRLKQGERLFYHVEPFAGANLEESALAFTGIDPYHPFRMAVPEKKALVELFDMVGQAVKKTACTRAILVGHNPFFDLGFLNAAVQRTKVRNNPFHKFSTFDTATLSALAYGQTVLARSVAAAGLEFDEKEAHSAAYDCERTAELFCRIVNHWHSISEQSTNK